VFDQMMKLMRAITCLSANENFFLAYFFTYIHHTKLLVVADTGTVCRPALHLLNTYARFRHPLNKMNICFVRGCSV